MDNKKAIKYEVGTRVRFVTNLVSLVSATAYELAKSRAIVVVEKVEQGDDHFKHHFKDVPSYYFGHELEPVAKPTILIQMRDKNV